MIIYGTGLFNRREHSLVRATCPACGRAGYQKSYTCSRFFTLYFVPVVPLGKFKVTMHCPHCQNAVGMSSRKWAKLRREDLARAVSHYETHPSDATAATEALGAAAAFQSRPSLQRIGPVIRSTFARDSAVIERLADTCSHLCMDKEADEAYLHAVSLSTDENLAARANEHIELQKLPKPTRPHRLLQSLPVLIVPAALLFAGATYLQKAVKAEVTQAYVLSGLEQPYSFILNGETITLRPFQRAFTDKVVFGRNEVEPAPDHPHVAAHTFSVDVPWYRRPFASPVVVVNPDRAGIVMWERTGYAQSTLPNSAHQVEVRSGRSYYVYESVDYPFQPFPDTINMSSRSSIAYRTRLSELRDLAPEQVVALFLERDDRESLRGHLRAKLAASHDDMRTIFAGAHVLPRDEFLGMALARLDERPVRLQWHRAYQNMVEQTPEGGDLAARYRGYARSEPASSELAYLLGRVIDDVDEQRAVWESAAAMPAPTGYAAHGLSYQHLLDGDFVRAASYADEALRIDPSNGHFRLTRQNAWYGTGDYAALDREWTEEFKGRIPSYADFHRHVFHLGRLGKTEEAKAEIREYMRRLEQQNPLSESDRGTGVAYLESALAVAANDKAAYAAAAVRINAPAWAFQLAVMRGDFEGAAALASQNDNGLGPQDRVMLYILLSRASRTAKAADQLERAVTILAEGRADQRRWAKWLKESAAAPTPREAAHACDEPDHHFLYLIALAYRHPEDAAGYLERARAIKFRDSFYTLALGEWMNGGPPRESIQGGD